ncbi:MAG: deoxyguanosinetriphosphate triphosphohydrolase [Phycisphaerae bacterium]
MHGSLAPYAVADDDASRQHSEPPHPWRSAFQIDRERVLHCTAFRRLDYKTQVFVPHEHDHFRTRLTHTLEVAQLARAVARALEVNEDLTEAVALAHDLGHPPFGHAGEHELAELMAEHGRFEHNRQSLRVVDYLEHPFPGFRGLNLTDATRECIARHQSRYDAPDVDGFEAGTHAPLEGQLVDACDEIAYTAHDLEDALTAEWITPDDLAHLDLWRLAWDAARQQYGDVRAIHLRIQACKKVPEMLADDLMTTTRQTLESLGAGSARDIRRAERRCAAFSPPMAERLDAMQRYLLEQVYRHPHSSAEDERGRRIVRELFGAYIADPDLLPERYRRRIESDSLHRVACDYIAGMTDRFCVREHARVCG